MIVGNAQLHTSVTLPAYLFITDWPISRSAKTVLIISHNLASFQRTSSSWIKRGARACSCGWTGASVDVVSKLPGLTGSTLLVGIQGCLLNYEIVVSNQGDLFSDDGVRGQVGPRCQPPSSAPQGSANRYFQE